MKSIIRILFFTLTMVLLCRCEKEKPQVTIPDNNFLNALIELGVDTDGDGKISPAEAEVVISLDVSGDSISDMTGIELFVNLDSLDCNNNQITVLDVSNNTALTSLDCYNNQLTSLDVSNNIALEWLICGDNPLTTLDISNNTALYYLSCYNAQLSTLDISSNIDLTNLSCVGNLLTTLDFSNNTTLEWVWCGDNQLTSLNVSNSTALVVLNCAANQLTSLDVSNNTALGTWPVYGFPDLNISQMPTLYQVCVWEMPFPPAGVDVDKTNSPNVYFTMDCN